ncbi:hypothetical protein [Streptomyces sp. MAI_2237]
MLQASRLKWVGRAREFEAAARMPGNDGRPRRAAFTPRMLGLLLLPALCVFVIRDTGVVVVLLALGLDWLGRAVAGAGWEHGNDRRLWPAPDPGPPQRLSHAPTDPSPAGD